MGNGDNRWAAGCAPIKFKMFFERKKNRIDKTKGMKYFIFQRIAQQQQTRRSPSLVSS